MYGSSVNRAGGVHVCVNGTWGKVCGGEHSPVFASIVCSQLGYSPYGMYVIPGLIHWVPWNCGSKKKTDTCSPKMKYVIIIISLAP